MNNRTKILVGIIVALIVANAIWVVNDIRKEINVQKITVQKEVNEKDKVILNLYKNLNEVKKVLKELDATNRVLKEDIANVPFNIKTEKAKIENNFQQAVVIIYNKSVGGLGSGVHIKYKGKFYILSAGHMTDTGEDKITFGENDVEIGECEIVKHDFVTVESDNPEDFTKNTDLLLLRVKDKKFIPKVYVELNELEPKSSTEIVVVGNPASIEDVVTDGRVIQYKNNFMYYIGLTYYGNSGGGVFTREGKLIGIVSHMYPISYNPSIPAYMTYGAVRLSVIKSFLENIKE